MLRFVCVCEYEGLLRPSQGIQAQMFNVSGSVRFWNTQADMAIK